MNERTHQTKSIAVLAPILDGHRARRATVRFNDGSRPCLPPEVWERLNRRLRPATGAHGGNQFVAGPENLKRENAGPVGRIRV